MYCELPQKYVYHVGISLRIVQVHGSLSQIISVRRSYTHYLDDTYQLPEEHPASSLHSCFKQDEESHHKRILLTIMK